MAIDYTKLFDRLRELIKHFNILEVRQTGIVEANYPLPYIKNKILDPYETQKVTSELATLETDFDTAISSVETLKRALIAYFEAALAGIASDLGEYAVASPLEVLGALADAMDRDSKTLNARELIVHASDVDTDLTIKPHTDNAAGTGRLVYIFVRPGLSPSEIANSEVLQCQCISSTTEKEEVFQLSGEGSHSRESHLGQGSGLGPTLTALGESIDNGDFEDWITPPAADNWTAVLPATWGTEIAQDAGQYEGTYCVKTDYLEGNWKITHPMPITLLPNTVYVMSLWVKKEAGATGTLRFGISDGDAVDAFVASCAYDKPVADLAETYTLKFVAFKTPAAVSSDWKLGISCASPGTKDFFFDLCQFGTMTAFNNMCFAICSGVTRFGIADKFGFGSAGRYGFEVAESEPGIIQKFIGRMFNTQLPSATGGNESSECSDP